MTTLVFLLEEPSAEEMLKGVLPKIFPDNISPEFVVFEGKQALEKRMPRILRAWCKPDCIFVVMRDQDSGNCLNIKHKLKALCDTSGHSDALIRIACRELESFYLGDLGAVEKGLKIKGLSAQQNKSKFRAPDNLGNPSEELDKLTKGLYQKVSGSRAIGPYLDPEQNRSHSFMVLMSGIRKLIKAG